MSAAAVRRRALVAFASAAGLALGACGGEDAAHAAFRAGRHADAAAAFSARVEAAGDAASPALLHDLALARWLAGDREGAERAAARAAGAADPVVAGRASLLRGLVAWARSEEAEAAAARPGADPRLAERALADAEDALARFRAAAVLLRGRPEAARDVERALLRVDRLRRKATERDRPPPPPAPQPPDAPPPPAPDAPPTAAPDPTRVTTELSAADLVRLREVLAAQEQRKAAERRARRLAPPAGGEDDR